MHWVWIATLDGDLRAAAPVPAEAIVARRSLLV
jgi:hypothetical protein